jgi:DnaJ-class molecular chaperone
MEYKDYYKTLGVSRDADGKAIKTAYRRLARKHHPDVNKGSSDRFKEISEAYEVLSDPEKRKRYDSLGPDWERQARAGSGSPFQGADVRFESGDLGDFSEFFRSIFSDLAGGRGGGRGRVRDFRTVNLGGDVITEDRGQSGGGGREKGEDVAGDIEISLEDAFRGANRTVSLEMDEPCSTCGGAGHVGQKPCDKCRGSGWQKGRRHLDVKIPAGVSTGSRVRVAGEGAGGLGGGARGDLYLKVTVTAHPRFERKGDDLHVELPVLAPDAALGAETLVPTLKGNVTMKIPPETSSGKTFRLPGYGMPRLRGGGAGDQYVKVQVTIPAGLTAREQDLYKELKQLRSESGR